jgi:hypothetical protein
MDRGKYAWIAESDDYADNRLLEELVSRLDADPDAVFAYCRSWRVSGEGLAVGFADSLYTDLDPKSGQRIFGPTDAKNAKNTPSIETPSLMLFRRDVYQRVRGADERLVLCRDWKTWVSMALTGGRIAYVGAPLNYFRFHDMTATVNSQRFGLDADQDLQVIRWMLGQVKPTKATGKKLCDDLFHFWSQRAASNRTPLSRRWAILKNASAIDRNALPKLVRPALVALRMMLSRRYRSLRSRV